MLTGKYQSIDNFEPNDTRQLLSRVSNEKGCTVDQLTLAWILAQGNDFFVIPGTTSTSL